MPTYTCWTMSSQLEGARDQKIRELPSALRATSDRSMGRWVPVKMANNIVLNHTALLFSLTLCSCLFKIKINVEFVELTLILLHQSQYKLEIEDLFRMQVMNSIIFVTES